jgi:hypothetical protein
MAEAASSRFLQRTKRQGCRFYFINADRAAVR